MGITLPYQTHASVHPERVAVKTSTKQINYQEWHRLIKQTGEWLGAITDSNKIVAILLPNSLELLQLFAGAASAGCTAVPLDPRWSPFEIQERLKICHPKVIIASQETIYKVEQLEYPKLLIENGMEIDDSPNSKSDSFINTSFYLGFTSGSTGKPKAFTRSHQSWIESFSCNQLDLDMTASEHVLIPGSLVHSHFLYGAISTLYLGGTVYLLEKFTVSKLTSFLTKFPISVLYVVPTMIEALIKEEISVDKQIKVISSGAKLESVTKEKMKQFFQRLSLYEFYGASELSFVSILSSEHPDEKKASVGRPCHNVKVEIRHLNGEIQPANEIGKIFVKSDLLFNGYLQSESNGMDKDGWMTVHDLGYLDKDGFLYLAGRESNMILYGGINIFPEEIESVLSQHPKVREAAVIGIQDEYWGSIIGAVIQGDPSKGELRSFCKEHLASFKIPRRWVFIDEMPHTISGKIDRVLVKKMFYEQIGMKS
ncbi:AMP-binding protein [Metabacillus arenae]|uniref:AMP-binding protein n=1 Tax=Metabacillus arenae TaxID=2771434 RepID=A0A926RX38_9BACI|nr:AMP-binding protein [Metabacillus arenae]MBD1380240.1 AMP-binding protein [Metabacillus arenae]